VHTSSARTSLPPSISIITCTLNQNKYIQELLNSVSQQELKNFEHIIVDGGSTDGTLKKIADYSKHSNGSFPIKLLSYPPKGISDAMNKGIEQAQGDWIIVVQGDDYLENTQSTQRMQREIIKRPSSAWLVGNFVRNYFGVTYNTHTYAIRPLLYRLLLRGINLISHQNMLMKKELFSKYGYFDTRYTTHMDTDLYLRLLENNVFPTTIDASFTVLRRHLGAASIRPDIYFSSLAILRPRLKEARKKIKWKRT